jgi:hypothetical protein
MCHRIVLGEAGVPTVGHRKHVEIEVTPRTYIVYKCEVKDLVSPLAFNIGFPSEQGRVGLNRLDNQLQKDSHDRNLELEFKNANLEIFLSANSRTPNK